VCRPYAGDELPADLTSYDALLVLGGSMGANDDAAHPWLTGVKELVRIAAERSVPTLGVCLGHQLAAVALGGAAAPNPRGQQVALLPTGWTPAASRDALFAGVVGENRGLQWNSDLVVTLPPGATVLAETPHGELQVARFAPSVWGVQLHPEVDARVLASWADGDRDDHLERGIDGDAVVAELDAAADELTAAWQPLATAFLGLIGTAR